MTTILMTRTRTTRTRAGEVAELDATRASTTFGDGMTDVIDLSLLKESRTLLVRLLARRGISYFLAEDGQQLFSLEAGRVEMVIETAVARQAKQGRRAHVRTVDYCRRELRRELIKRAAGQMMRSAR